MHYLINKFFLAILGMLLATTANANSDNLYTCMFNGTSTTYHENDARRMILLGADCRIMNNIEHITCSMDGVKVHYALDEAEALLYRHADAYCEMNSKLFRGSTKKDKGLSLVKKLFVYFPVNSANITRETRDKLHKLARQYKNMGYSYTITGYASATGKASKNYLLSLRRAGSVKHVLHNNGINNIISVDALGEESLRYKTRYEFKLNRAVEIKVYQ